MSELKPCAHCGNAAEIYSAVTRIPNDDGSLQGHWVADCTVCNASIEFCCSQEDALTKWNTRIEPQWQDISTAPKDGRTYILVASPKFDGGCAVVCWDEEANWWMLDDGKNFEISMRGPAPTHWMPLPKPPQDSKE